MIQIRELTKSFDNIMLFDKLTFDIDDGEFVVFSGNSGCGKTTLLNMIGGIEDIDSGDIVVNGISLKDKRKQYKYLKEEVGFLFQNFALIENKTVEENLKIIRKECKTDISIEQALSCVGLIGKLRKKVYTLSGGEQQRVALARLMIKKCNIILADEPTGSLDKDNAKVVINLLKSLHEKGKTIIMVTHDESLKKVGTRLIEL